MTGGAPCPGIAEVVDAEQSFAERLLRWFARHGRKDLPWQRDRTPYRVWLSEIMLQQTQVSTVIPYFERFITVFPDVGALAVAPLDEVLHRWAGLGYYARARNVHRAAGIIAARHGGVFPDRMEALVELPGIGRSTAGAILAIAFNQRAPILDGNVKRVLTRHAAVAGSPARTQVARQLWALAAARTPAKDPAGYTQAIMDLGATLCTRSRPQCSQCPVNQDCRAYAAGDATAYPSRTVRTPLPVRESLLLILQNANGEILLSQRPPTGVWGGLWSFPECAATEALIATETRAWHCEPVHWQLMPPRRHTFSHFHLDYVPVVVQVVPGAGIADADNRRWIDPAQPGGIGLPKPVATLLQEIARERT